MNRALPFFHRGSLEITLIIPLTIKIYKNFGYDTQLQYSPEFEEKNTN